MPHRDDPTPTLEKLLEEIRSSKEAILSSEKRLEEATDLLYQWLEASGPTEPPSRVWADEPEGRAHPPVQTSSHAPDQTSSHSHGHGSSQPHGPASSHSHGHASSHPPPAIPAIIAEPAPPAPAARLSSQEDFLHVISHDLKEPMRGIIYFTQLLSEDYGYKLDEEGRGHLEYILAATKRMNRLLEDVLALSRLQRRAMSLTRTDLGALLQAVIGELKAPLKEKRGSVDVRATLPVLEVDTGRMHDVFLQLLKNAIMYSDPPARIEVGAEPQGADLWRFWVRDHGMGIERQFLEQIFGLFQRLHTWEAYEGTGAGLTLARMVVELHGGKMWAESAPGKGSTFYFTLPVVREDDE